MSRPSSSASACSFQKVHGFWSWTKSAATSGRLIRSRCSILGNILIRASTRSAKRYRLSLPRVIAAGNLAQWFLNASGKQRMLLPGSLPHSFKHRKSPLAAFRFSANRGTAAPSQPANSLSRSAKSLRSCKKRCRPLAATCSRCVHESLKIKAMPRLLLFTAKLGYQTRSFDQAARKLGVDLLFVTDRCHQLDDPWGDRAISVPFESPEAAAYAVLEAVRGQNVDGILTLGDRPTVAASYVARGLGILYNHPAAVEACRSKLRMREVS